MNLCGVGCAGTRNGAYALAIKLQMDELRAQEQQARVLATIAAILLSFPPDTETDGMHKVRYDGLHTFIHQ